LFPYILFLALALPRNEGYLHGIPWSFKIGTVLL
jgi:hypothetical protein